jgi:hypothetical protein
VNGGFNRGVDFKSGLSLQFQVAPASFTIRYTGAGSATISIPAGEQALTAAGDFIISLTAEDGTRTDTPFRWADYPTITAFTEALAECPAWRPRSRAMPAPIPGSSFRSCARPP